MSPHRSLAEEKEALLAKMQASRVAYRRMLVGTDKQSATVQDVTPLNSFPRSKTVRWIQHHPYLLIAGLTVAVLATRRTPRKMIKTAAQKGRNVSSSFMRNQNRIRMTLGLVTTLVRFIEQRRHK